MVSAFTSTARRSSKQSASPSSSYCAKDRPAAAARRGLRRSRPTASGRGEATQSVTREPHRPAARPWRARAGKEGCTPTPWHLVREGGGGAWPLAGERCPSLHAPRAAPPRVLLARRAACSEHRARTAVHSEAGLNLCVGGLGCLRRSRSLPSSSDAVSSTTALRHFCAFLLRLRISTPNQVRERRQAALHHRAAAGSVAPQSAAASPLASPSMTPSVRFVRRVRPLRGRRAPAVRLRLARAALFADHAVRAPARRECRAAAIAVALGANEREQLGASRAHHIRASAAAPRTAGLSACRGHGAQRARDGATSAARRGD